MFFWAILTNNTVKNWRLKTACEKMATRGTALWNIWTMMFVPSLFLITYSSLHFLLPFSHVFVILVST